MVLDRPQEAEFEAVMEAVEEVIALVQNLDLKFRTVYMEKLKHIKGEKGDKGEAGYSPKKGKDYYTVKERQELVAEVLQKATPKIGIDYLTSTERQQIIDTIVARATPKKGEHYFDAVAPKKGVDYFTEDDKQAIAKMVVDMLAGRTVDEKEIDLSNIKEYVQNLLPKGNTFLRGGRSTTVLDSNGRTIAKNPQVIKFASNLTVTESQGTVTVSASGGGGGNTLVVEEVPTGTIDGSNAVFTLGHTPVAGTLRVYLNGARQQGGGGDYTLSTATITFISAPPTGSILFADYEY